MMLPSVVVAGHICLDVFPDLGSLPAGSMEELLQPGRLTVVGPVSFSTGGPVSNTGLVLHKLGVPTRLLGKIGDDPFGKVVCQIVEGFGKELLGGMVTDPKVSTSYTVVISPPGTDRIFLHCPGANDTFGPEDIKPELLKEAAVFHFGYPPLMRRMFLQDGRELAGIFHGAKEAGVTTSLDMAFPDGASEAGRADWGVILKAVLPAVDIFMPSVEETIFLLRRDLYNALNARAGNGNILPLVDQELLHGLSSELLELGVAIVGLKMGDRGLYLRSGNIGRLQQVGRLRVDAGVWARQELFAPCFKVQTVGTTGSGDATIAGFLAALVRGLGPKDAVTAAVAVGACNVEAADALSGIRTWEATQERIASGWVRCE